MKKEKIIEKLEEKFNHGDECLLFEPSCCPKCKEIFDWLWRSIKVSK